MISYKKSNINKFLICSMLFAFSISLFNLAGYIFALLVLMLMIIGTSSIKVGIEDIYIIAFSVCYFVFYWINYDIGIETIIIFLIGPWSAFWLGKTYIANYNSSKEFIQFLIVLSLGMFIHGLLNWLAYMNSSHMEYYDYYRQSVDIWRGTIVNVNTTGMYFTFFTGICLGVIFTKQSYKMKLFALTMVTSSLAATVFFASRTLLYIAGIIVLWQSGKLLLSSKLLFRKKIVLIELLICAAFILLYIYINNVWGLNDAFNSLKLVQRISAGETTSRWSVWTVFFDNMNFMDHMFGGGDLLENTPLNYMHNMWLDVYNVAGILPFILLVVITFRSIKKICYYNVIARYDHYNESVIVTCLFVAIFLNCMVEPIIEANPYYFLIVMMFIGATDSRRKILKNKLGRDYEE